jgi:hypothetical protein
MTTVSAVPLSRAEWLVEYQLAMTALANAKARVAVLRDIARFGFFADPKPNENKPAQNKPESRTEKFIKRFRSRFEDWDIKFLEQESRPASEVADYLLKHRNYPAEALKQGIFRPGRGDRPKKRMIDTISVVQQHLCIDTDVEAAL